MLKKFWEWIRRLFAAPPEKTDQALSTEKRRAWFEQCEPGFLVWARMPLPEEELAKVEPAHPSGYIGSHVDVVNNGYVAENPSAYVKNYTEMNALITPALESAFLGNKTVQEALDEIEGDVDKLLDGRYDK